MSGLSCDTLSSYGVSKNTICKLQLSNFDWDKLSESLSNSFMNEDLSCAEVKEICCGVVQYLYHSHNTDANELKRLSVERFSNTLRELGASDRVINIAKVYKISNYNNLKDLLSDDNFELDYDIRFILELRSEIYNLLKKVEGDDIILPADSFLRTDARDVHFRAMACSTLCDYLEKNGIPGSVRRGVTRLQLISIEEFKNLKEEDFRKMKGVGKAITRKVLKIMETL